MIEVNPDALAIAAMRDGERTRGRVRGQLHGIPFLIKDVCVDKDVEQLDSWNHELILDLLSI